MQNHKDYTRTYLILRHVLFMVIVAIVAAVFMDSIVSTINRLELPMAFPLGRRIILDIFAGLLSCFFTLRKTLQAMSDYDKRKLAKIQPQEVPHDPAEDIVKPYPFSFTSLVVLEKYVSERWIKGVNKDFILTFETDYIETTNFERFKDEILGMDTSDKSYEKIFDYIWFTLVSLYNENAGHQEGLDQRNEPYFSTLNIEFALYKYIGFVYTLSNSSPQNCFEKRLRRLGIDFKDLGRLKLLEQIADKQDDKIKYFKNEKAEQCKNCLEKGCMGRFKRLSKDIIDLVGPYLDDSLPTEDELEAERRMDRLSRIYNTEELSKEIVAGLSMRTPLQDLYKMLTKPYWNDIVESYLRIMGVPVLAENGEQERQVESDNIVMTVEPSDFQDEYHRWRSLLHDFDDVIERNINDKQYIKIYFADILKHFSKMALYMNPPAESYRQYKTAPALMRLASDSMCPNLGTIKRIFSDTVQIVDERDRQEHFTPEQYEDTLYRALYERANLVKFDIYEESNLYCISVFYECLEILCMQIDRALKGNNVGFGVDEIQAFAGITLVKDIDSLYQKHSIILDDLIRAGKLLVESGEIDANPPLIAVPQSEPTIEVSPNGEETKRQEPDDENETKDDNLNDVMVSERMAMYLERASCLFENGEWKGTKFKDYALFWKELWRAVYKPHKDSFSVPWRTLPIRPMKNGKLVSSEQLKNALKFADDIKDAALIERYQKILNKE